MLKHDCDVTFGDYGSPILVRDGKKIGVGALNVAVGPRNGKSVDRDLPPKGRGEMTNASRPSCRHLVLHLSKDANASEGFLVLRQAQLEAAF